MKNFTRKVLLSTIVLMVICFTLKAQTNVSGGIYSNTTWTKANSPYIVTDTVVVFPSVTLTIDPGVTVKFADKMLLEIRLASIIALGTAVDSITFTSNSLSPIPGIWNALIIDGDSMSSSFNYCNFRYATTGLQSSLYSKTLTIRNSSFTSNITGANINGRQIYIDTCIFNNNSESGLTGGNAIMNINYCTFSHNQYGIGDNFNEGPGGIFKNCLIDSNQVGAAVAGIEFYDIENCIISNNTDGLSVWDGMQSMIKNCTVTNNSGIGIQFQGEQGGDSIVSCQVKNNGTGITAWCRNDMDFGNDAITMNDIESNGIGIDVQYDEGCIYCNKICSNSSYDMKNEMTYTYYEAIPDNFWCSTDSATIASHIYDGYDNVSLGLVHFIPFDTVGCYLTGCNIQLTSTVTNATCDTCHNGSATLNVANGHPTITYTWLTSPIQYTKTATSLASGTYSVCVSDGNGCTACTSVFVDSSNCTGFSIVANGTNATCLLCNDGKAWVDVTNGTAPYSYTWYTIPIQNTDTAYNLLHGSYSVCVTDLYGCAACDSVTIGTGSCSAHFNLYPDTSILHTYIAVNMASGAGTLTYDWNWGDGGAHDNTPFPSHTYATAGFYKICLTITDTAGCTDTYCNSFYLLRTTNTMIYVMVIPPVNTGVIENSANASFAVFPNPASHNLTLIMPDNASKGTVKIFNLLGEKTYSSVITKQETDLDISGLSNGIYVIEVDYGDTISRQKFIKE